LTSVRNVIFDFGGVLVNWRPQEIIDTFYSEPALREALRAHAFHHDDWLEMDRGTLDEASVARRCAARMAGDQESYPRKSPKPERPTRKGVAFWAIRGDGAVLLRRRPEKGLLGGMMEIPSTEWREAGWDTQEALPHAPLNLSWRPLGGVVRHTFTHFHLELEVMAAENPGEGGPAESFWWPVDRLSEQALPTVMKKIVRHALGKV